MPANTSNSYGLVIGQAGPASGQRDPAPVVTPATVAPVTPPRVVNTPGGGNVGPFNAASPAPVAPAGGWTPAPKISPITAQTSFVDAQLKDAAAPPDSEPAGYTPPPSIFAKIWDWLLTHPTDTTGLNQFIWGTLASFTLGLLWKLGRRK